MTHPGAALRQYLLRAIDAYGSDLVLPRGTVRPRTAPAVEDPVAGHADTEPDAPAPALPAAVAAAGQDVRAAAPTGGAAAPAPAPAAGPAAEALPPAASTGAAAAANSALDALRAEALACTRCRLHEGRTCVVFGEGAPDAAVLFVGEGPGANEDRSGRPFVGDAGGLLTRILNGAMGLRRADVYIANVVKCRPPGNRTPAPDEAGACMPFLKRQVEIVRPRVIVCLGRTAAHHLLGRDEPVGRLRGQTLDYLGIPVVVTWHPAYLLREESRKRETWEDVMRVNRLLGRPDKPAPVVETT